MDLTCLDATHVVAMMRGVVYFDDIIADVGSLEAMYPDILHRQDGGPRRTKNVSCCSRESIC